MIHVYHDITLVTATAMLASTAADRLGRPITKSASMASDTNGTAGANWPIDAPDSSGTRTIVSFFMFIIKAFNHSHTILCTLAIEIKHSITATADFYGIHF